jgi:predicted ABC-type ATPase
MTFAYKDVVMIGGPNGAGKTTAATRLLPKWLGIREFVNADEIARGLSPFNPEGSALAAGRLMIERIQELIERGESFSFETTCSGRAHARTLAKCRDAGYRITLIFLWLPSAKEALKRVARRLPRVDIGYPRTSFFAVMTPGEKSSTALSPDCRHRLHL